MQFFFPKKITKKPNNENLALSNHQKSNTQDNDLQASTRDLIKLIEKIADKNQFSQISYLEYQEKVKEFFSLSKTIFDEFQGKPIYYLDKHFKEVIYEHLINIISSTYKDILEILKFQDFSISLSNQTEAKIRSIENISLMIARRIRLYSMCIQFSEKITEDKKLSIGTILLDDIISAFLSFKNLIRDLSEINQAISNPNNSFNLFIKICESKYLSDYIDNNSGNKISAIIRIVKDAEANGIKIETFSSLKELLSSTGQKDLIDYVDIMGNYIERISVVTGKYFLVENSNIFSDTFLVLNYPKDGFLKFIATGIIYIDENFALYSRAKKTNPDKLEEMLSYMITSIPKLSMFSNFLYIGLYNPLMVLKHRCNSSVSVDDDIDYLIKRLESIHATYLNMIMKKKMEIESEITDSNVKQIINESLNKLDHEIHRQFFYLISVVNSCVNYNMPIVDASLQALTALERFVNNELNLLLKSINSNLDETAILKILQRFSLANRSKDEILKFVYMNDQNYPTIMLPMSMSRESRVFDTFFGIVDLSSLLIRFRHDKEFVDKIKDHFLQFMAKAKISMLTNQYTVAQTDGSTIEIAPFSYLYTSRELNFLATLQSLYHEAAHLSFNSFSIKCSDISDSIHWRTRFNIVDLDGYSLNQHVDVVVEFLNSVLVKVNNEIRKKKSERININHYFSLVSEFAYEELLSRYPDLKEIIEESQKKNIPLVRLAADDKSIKSTLITLVSLMTDVRLFSQTNNITEDCRIDELLLKKPIRIPERGIDIRLDEQTASFYKILNNLLISYYHFYRAERTTGIKIDELTDVDTKFMLNTLLTALKLDTDVFLRNFSIKIESDKLSEQQKNELISAIINAIDEIKTDILDSSNIEKRYSSLLATFKFFTILTVLRRYDIYLVFGGKGSKSDESASKKEEKPEEENGDIIKREESSETLSTSVYQLIVSKELVARYKDYFSQIRSGEIVTQKIRSNNRGVLDVRKASENFAAHSNVSSMFIRKKSLIDFNLGNSILQKPLVIYLAIDTSGSMKGARSEINTNIPDMTPVELSLMHVGAIIIGYLESLKENPIDVLYRKITLKLLSVSDEKFAEIEINPKTFSYRKIDSVFRLEIPFTIIGEGTDLSTMIGSCMKVIEKTNDRINEEFLSKIETSSYHDAVKPDYLFLFFTDFGNTAGSIQDVNKVIDKLKSYADQNASKTKSNLSSGSKLGVIFVAPITDSTLLDQHYMEEIGKRIPISEITIIDINDFIQSLNHLIKIFTNDIKASSNIQ